MPSPRPPASSHRLTLHGAAGEVTGSCSLLETSAGSILVDFGLLQGSRRDEWRNLDPPPIDFHSLAAVVLTHAHVDHCGRLPMLGRLGYRGPLYCTRGTAELLPRVLRGSARLQRTRLEEFHQGTWPEALPLWLEAGQDPASIPSTPAPDEPPLLYESGEVEHLLRRIHAVDFGERVALGRGISIRFGFAGHVHGAAHVIVEQQDRAIAVFSGDVGSPHTGMLRPVDPLPACDLLVLESTRGDRLVADAPEPERELASVLDEVRACGGTLLLPTFALGRAQQIVWRLSTAATNGHLDGLSVYLDAPMAEFALRLVRHATEDLAEPLQRRMAAGDDPFAVPNVRALFTRSDSLKIAAKPRSVILAGAGFCDAGPILHHLAEGLPREDVRVGLSGWYPDRSLGWGLLRDCTHARINREVVPVRAGRRRLEGYSGHASAEELAAWSCSGPDRPRTIVLNHGTQDSRNALADRLRGEGHRDVRTPASGEVVELGGG